MRMSWRASTGGRAGQAGRVGRPGRGLAGGPGTQAGAGLAPVQAGRVGQPEPGQDVGQASLRQAAARRDDSCRALAGRRAELDGRADTDFIWNLALL